MDLAASQVLCPTVRQNTKKSCAWGGLTYKSTLFCYPLKLLDRVKSVIQRDGLREVPLFDDRDQFIESINRILHKHPPEGGSCYLAAWTV